MNLQLMKKFLIPRPDTEIIIEQVLKIYKKNKINFLDIGFGSGCILLSILKEKKDFKATGIDISNHALRVCKSMLISQELKIELDYLNQILTNSLRGNMI